MGAPAIDMFPDLEKTKKCTKCGKVLPIDYFHKRRFKKKYVYLRGDCKYCERKAVDRWHSENPEAKKRLARQYWQKLERETDLHYGGSCWLCGATKKGGMRRTPSLHHIYGEGKTKRKQHPRSNGATAQHCRVGGWPRGLARLCDDCHWIAHRFPRVAIWIIEEEKRRYSGDGRPEPEEPSEVQEIIARAERLRDGQMKRAAG